MHHLDPILTLSWLVRWFRDLTNRLILSSVHGWNYCLPSLKVLCIFSFRFPLQKCDVDDFVSIRSENEKDNSGCSKIIGKYTNIGLLYVTPPWMPLWTASYAWYVMAQLQLNGTGCSPRPLKRDISSYYLRFHLPRQLTTYLKFSLVIISLLSRHYTLLGACSIGLNVLLSTIAGV